jgi:hypothetical protein
LTGLEMREKKMPDIAVKAIADGECKCICEGNWDEYRCAEEPLPDRMRLLLCLIDGAERRQALLRRWLGEAPAIGSEARSEEAELIRQRPIQYWRSVSLESPLSAC